MIAKRKDVAEFYKFKRTIIFIAERKIKILWLKLIRDITVDICCGSGSGSGSGRIILAGFGHEGPDLVLPWTDFNIGMNNDKAYETFINTRTYSKCIL